jgi:hypothetical protein
VNKKGTLTFRFNRKPAWISDAEMREVSEKTGIPLNIVFIRAKARGATFG